MVYRPSIVRPSSEIWTTVCRGYTLIMHCAKSYLLALSIILMWIQLVAISRVDARVSCTEWGSGNVTCIWDFAQKLCCGVAGFITSWYLYCAPDKFLRYEECDYPSVCHESGGTEGCPIEDYCGSPRRVRKLFKHLLMKRKRGK